MRSVTPRHALLCAALLLSHQRLCGLRVVEAVLCWRQREEDEEEERRAYAVPTAEQHAFSHRTVVAARVPKAFVWRGHNYLVRMALDQPFVPLPLATDPLLLHWFDEHAAVWSSEQAVDPLPFGARRALPEPVLARLDVAARKIRDEVRRYRVTVLTDACGLGDDARAVELRWLLYGEPHHAFGEALALLQLMQAATGLQRAARLFLARRKAELTDHVEVQGRQFAPAQSGRAQVRAKLAPAPDPRGGRRRPP